MPPGLPKCKNCGDADAVCTMPTGNVGDVKLCNDCAYDISTLKKNFLFFDLFNLTMTEVDGEIVMTQNIYVPTAPKK